MQSPKQIQTHLFPKSLPETDSIRFDVRYYPHGQVGGDFYDVFAVDESRYAVFVADVQGHGVSAALYTMMLKTLIHSHNSLAGAPAEFMAAVNRDLESFVIPGGFASAVYAVVDVAKDHVTYTNAGHPPPLLFRSGDGKAGPLEGKGMLLGVMPDLRYDSATFDLAPGDLLLFYTDGVTEAADAAGKMLGTDGLADLLAKEAPKKHPKILDRLYAHVNDYCNQVALPDDVLLLSVARKTSH